MYEWKTSTLDNPCGETGMICKIALCETINIARSDAQIRLSGHSGRTHPDAAVFQLRSIPLLHWAINSKRGRESCIAPIYRLPWLVSRESSKSTGKSNLKVFEMKFSENELNSTIRAMVSNYGALLNGSRGACCERNKRLQQHRSSDGKRPARDRNRQRSRSASVEIIETVAIDLALCAGDWEIEYFSTPLLSPG